MKMASLSFHESFGTLFYTVSPNRTSFETVEEVPNYFLQAVPHFALLVVVEQLYMILSRRPMGRVNDMVTSVFQGMMQEAVGLLFYGWRLFCYSYIYTNWRVVTLPWNSLWTWWICFLIVDFLYYWAHRACHEINFLWAAHQVHHSSEYYNLTTALRQSATLNALQWVFYLPMALAIPPSVYLVHSFLNLLYQFWIHTEAIKSIGPLEYILNTASHHKVHHGRNKYCIDKNYAGVLIIWDRMFGTFEAEKETVVYGLTHNIDSFDLVHVQLGHFKHIWQTFWEMEGWKNKLSVLVKGPGWSPGKPWHGNPEDIPEVKYPFEKYDPKLSIWSTVYALWHALLIIGKYLLVGVHHKELPVLTFYALVAFIVMSMSALGHFFEKRRSSPLIELLRCMLYFVLEKYCLSQIEVFPPFVLHAFRLSYGASALFWVKYFLHNVNITWHPLTKKVD